MSLWQRTTCSLTRLNPRLLSLVNLAHLLQQCSNSRSQNPALQLHQQITVSGLLGNPFIVTKLVQAYADCDNLSSAHKLFDKLPQPNVFTWTAILAFYLRHRRYEECIRDYGLMKYRSVLRDNYVFPRVLPACTQLKWLEGGVWVHKDVIVCGCEFDLPVCNSLIDMYAKCEDVKSARRVLDGMVNRDLFTWNIMISGYLCNGMVDCALEVLGLLGLDGFEPDVATYNMLMDGYCRMGCCDEALKIFEEIQEPNIISWTTLISGYLCLGKHEKSLRIFKDMVNGGTVCPDLRSLSSVVVSCRHLGALMIGKEIHGYGIKSKSRAAFYSSTGAGLLAMYAKCGKMKDAGHVFELMDKSDVVAWNARILGFVEQDLGHLALECFCEMQRLGTESDQTTICTVLPVCHLKCGKQIHAYISKNNLFSSLPVRNALIHMYFKCGCIGSAYTVFSGVAAKDIVSWNTMIGGFGMHGLGQAALQFLQKMNQSGVSPNSLTFTSLLSACSHSGIVDEGLKLFHSMTKEYGRIPRIEHYSCVVDILARAGRFEEAISFIQRMPLPPTKHIWGAVLAASRDHQNLNVGRLAAEHLIHLEPEQSGHYVTLSDTYAGAGRWDDAARVRKQMESRGSVKPSGQSWIEIGRSAHVNQALQ